MHEPMRLCLLIRCPCLEYWTIGGVPIAELRRTSKTRARSKPRATRELTLGRRDA